MTEKEFIDQLVAIRKENGIAQLSSALAMGIQPQKIKRLENATSTPRLDTVMLYLNYFGKNIALKKRKPFIVHDTSDISRFIENVFEKTSAIEISKIAGCAIETVKSCGRNPGKVSLKIFIDICTAIGYSIEIVDKNEEEPIMPDQFFKMGGVATIGKRTICDILSFMSYDGECDRASFNLNGETYEFSNAGKSFKISCFVRK